MNLLKVAGLVDDFYSAGDCFDYLVIFNRIPWILYFLSRKTCVFDKLIIKIKIITELPTQKKYWVGYFKIFKCTLQRERYQENYEKPKFQLKKTFDCKM